MTASSITPAERTRNFLGDAFQNLEDPEIRRTFNTWVSMLDRCMVPGHESGERYLGRGITVCERWFSFANFAADMGPRPEGMTLDRIDNDGNYEPGNCRWADRLTQARNTSRTKRIDVDGQIRTQSEIAAASGLSNATIMRRSRAGLKGQALIDPKPRIARKLTPEQVHEIRRLISIGLPNTQIAARFGCSHTNIRSIRLGQTWAQP